MHPEEANKYREMMEAVEGGRKGKEKGNEKGQTKARIRARRKVKQKARVTARRGQRERRNTRRTRTKSTPGSSVYILRILVPDPWEQAHCACHDQMSLHVCCTAASLRR